jgi:hypothetical protein
VGRKRFLAVFGVVPGVVEFGECRADCCGLASCFGVFFLSFGGGVTGVGLSGFVDLFYRINTDKQGSEEMNTDVGSSLVYLAVNSLCNQQLGSVDGSQCFQWSETKSVLTADDGMLMLTKTIPNQNCFEPMGRRGLD